MDGGPGTPPKSSPSNASAVRSSIRLFAARTYLSAACEDESPRNACTSATWAPRCASRVAPVALRSWKLMGRPTASRTSRQPPETSKQRWQARDRVLAVQPVSM